MGERSLFTTMLFNSDSDGDSLPGDPEPMPSHSNNPYLHPGLSSSNVSEMRRDLDEELHGIEAKLTDKNSNSAVKIWVDYITRMSDGGREVLLMGLAADQEDLVKPLLFAGVDISFADERAVTSLLRSSKEGKLWLVNQLLSRLPEASDTVMNSILSPSLSLASSAAHTEVVEALICAGADINARGSRGSTAMIEAAQRGDNHLVGFLIARHASLNVVNLRGESAILVASKNGHGDVVRTLVEAGADINHSNNRGRTPLMMAYRNGHGEVARYLHGNGALTTVDDMGNSVHSHALLGQPERGIDELASELGEGLTTEALSSALRAAASVEDERVTRALLQKDVNVDARDRIGRTPLMIASSRGHSAVVGLLLTSKADVNATTESRTGALHIASEKGHSHVVQQLLSHGAHANVRDHQGCTALWRAVFEGSYDVVCLLVNNGADVNVARDSGVTPLMVAVGEGHDAIFELLLNHGAYFNVRDEFGFTPLTFAAVRGRTAMVGVLIDLWCRVNSVDWCGNTILDNVRRQLVRARLFQSTSEKRDQMRFRVRLTAVYLGLVNRGGLSGRDRRLRRSWRMRISQREWRYRPHLVRAKTELFRRRRYGLWPGLGVRSDSSSTRRRRDGSPLSKKTRVSPTGDHEI